jgi:hypothetical protein
MDKESKVLFEHILVQLHGKVPEELKSLLVVKASFSAPTLEEVEAYLKELKIFEAKANALKFHSFYDAKGWMIGKNKMKNWKSAVKTWSFPKNQLVL